MCLVVKRFVGECIAKLEVAAGFRDADGDAMGMIGIHRHRLGAFGIAAPFAFERREMARSKVGMARIGKSDCRGVVVVGRMRSPPAHRNGVVGGHVVNFCLGPQPIHVEPLLEPCHGRFLSFDQ